MAAGRIGTRFTTFHASTSDLRFVEKSDTVTKSFLVKNRLVIGSGAVKVST